MTNEIKFERPEPQVAPPVTLEEPTAEGEAIEAARVEGEARAAKGGVPLKPAVVRMTLRSEGFLLEYFTGYEGFLYDEATLNDLAELAQDLDVRLSPLAQFITGIVSVHMVKVGGYIAWRRAGKPESKAKEVGEQP